MNNELVGIGAVLEMIDGYCTIKELLPGVRQKLLEDWMLRTKLLK